VNVGVFGGSFNPPHIAHVLACALVLSLEDLDTLLVVPTYRHPFAKSLASFEDRSRMCELAMGWIPGVAVSRVEEELGGESRTLRTLGHLGRTHPDWRLRLVVGADVLSEASRWFGFDEIARLAPLIVLPRAGSDGVPPLLPDISSTQVREAIEREAWADVERLVPRTVLAYLRTHNLYEARK
jgi:nicotinate-nucleotide adenylyltransferase